MDKNNLILHRDSELIFENFFTEFNAALFTMESAGNFTAKFSFSVDQYNWSHPVPLDIFTAPPKDSVPFRIKMLITFDHTQKESLQPTTKNTYQTDENVLLCEIKTLQYNGTVLEYVANAKKQDVTLKTPRWNIYNNIQPEIDDWLNENSATAYETGILCIYFKTEVTEFSGTLNVPKEREVKDIKMLHINLVDGALPSKQVSFSQFEESYPDFQVHIVCGVFETAFGENSFPEEKDYLYIPMLRKMFTVSSPNPADTQFCGVHAWWEVYLNAYEKDVTIDYVPENHDQDVDDIFAEIHSIFSSKENDAANIDAVSIEEQKNVTDNFFNTVEDSTHYISVKETEKHREYLHKTLDIVSIRPSESQFPVNMYDCSNIATNEIAVSYNLSDYTEKNKFGLETKQSYTFSFDFTVLKRFSGTLFSFADITAAMSRKRKITFITNGTEHEIDYVFNDMELYRLEITHDISKMSFSYKIFLCSKHGTSELVHNDLFIDNTLFMDRSVMLSGAYIYGGSYLVNNVTVFCSTNKIFTDKAKHLTVMKKY